MDHIATLFKEYAPAKENKNERGELYRYFLSHLNPARVKDGFKPMTMARMGKVLEGIPTKDLYYLQSVCSKAPHFSKRFWWELSTRQKDSSVQT